MSKVMQRELTITTCNVAKTVIGEGGFPVLTPLDPQTIIGAVTQPQAERIIRERLAQEVKDGAPEGTTEKQVEEGIKLATEGIVIFGLTSTTEVYELPVETFFKYATIQVQLSDEEKAIKAKEKALDAADKAKTRALELRDKAVKKVEELDKDIADITAAIAAASGDDLKKLEDKLESTHERRLKAFKKMEERQKTLMAADKELSKLQK